MTVLPALLLVNLLGPLVAEASARDDIAAECAQANIGSVASLLGPEAPSFIEASTEQQISEEFLSNDYAPWALEMYPGAKGRMGGVLIQIAHIERMRRSLGPGTHPPLAQWFKEAARSSPVLSPATRAFLKSEFREWRKDRSFDREIRAFRAAAPYFCSAFRTFGCVTPVNRILTWMHPHIARDWTAGMVDLWEKVLSDPGYYAGLAKAASVIHQRITGVRVNRDPRAAIGDVFSDLVAGYRAVGQPEAEARDRAFDILGVYGTRGASILIAYYLARPETAPLIAALTFISSAMSYLDLVQPPGRYYSMPGTSGTCRYGKPYHFWMTAHFVYRLSHQRAIDAREAAVAAHLVGRVYETNSNTLGRDPDQVFYEKLFSSHNNQLRANIVVNDAGAIWAAEYGRRSLNIDAGIRLLKNKAIPLPLMTPEALAALLRKPIERDKAWVQIIQPDVLIKEWVDRTGETAHAQFFRKTGSPVDVVR